MVATIPQPASAALRPEHVAALRKLLDALEAHHAEQIALLAEHRFAIGKADQALLAACVQRQQSAALNLSELEQRRSVLVRQIVGPKAPALTLRQLAAMAGADESPRLMSQAARVRSLVAQCLEKQSVIAAASTSLLAHVHGLVRQIARNLSETGAYARGSMVQQSSSAGAVDLVS